MPTPFVPRLHAGHPLHAEPMLVAGCPECEMALSLLLIEADLRDLSVDLWVAGCMPSDLLAHVSRQVADPRAVDLVAHGVLFEDTTRAEHARPPAWRSEIERLRHEFGVGPSGLGCGWLADWVRDRSESGLVGQVAAVIEQTMQVLSDLSRPAIDLTSGDPRG